MPAVSLYSHRDYLPSGAIWTPLLFPFWGVPDAGAPNVALKRFDRWSEVGHRFFQLRETMDCDFFVLPFDWQITAHHSGASSAAMKMADLAGRAKKPLLVFDSSDSEAEIPLPNAIIFRTSLLRDRRSNEFPFPAWCDDFLGGDAVPRRLRLHSPSVGFCGFAGYRLLPDVGHVRRIRSMARIVRKKFPSMTVRERAIKNLRGDSRLITNFILREQFYGGVSMKTVAERQRVQAEYLHNLIANDFTLCARGGGNFSFRFFETLAMGRIPLFIDTECVLPYERLGIYEDVILRVDERDLRLLGDAVVAYHAGLTNEDFSERQQECRVVWERFLSPYGFFSNLPALLEDAGSTVFTS